MNLDIDTHLKTKSGPGEIVQQWVLLLQKTQVWFPAPATVGQSQQSVTPAPADLTSSSGFFCVVFLFSYMHMTARAQWLFIFIALNLCFVLLFGFFWRDVYSFLGLGMALPFCSFWGL